MPAKVEGRAREILEGKNYAIVAIPRQDGTVQSVVVWAHLDDDGNVTLNSAEGRQWPANLRRAKTATVTAMADSNPYEYVSVTCALADDTHEGADEHINALSSKFIDEAEYPYRQPDEQRVMFTLTPERVDYTKQG